MADAAPAVLHAEPQLFVRDMAAALAFYREGLGFAVAFEHGEPVFYAQVRRGGARLNLRLLPEASPSEVLRAGEPDLLAATVVVAGAEALFEEFRDRGVAIAQPLRTEPWGARTFIVRDPDGALILFAAEA